MVLPKDGLFPTDQVLVDEFGRNIQTISAILADGMVPLLANNQSLREVVLEYPKLLAGYAGLKGAKALQDVIALDVGMLGKVPENVRNQFVNVLATLPDQLFHNSPDKSGTLIVAGMLEMLAQLTTPQR